MRSDLVFRANDKVPNRFHLCRLAACSARTMIRSSVEMHHTINQALEAISHETVFAMPAAAVDIAAIPAPVLDLGPSLSEAESLV